MITPDRNNTPVQGVPGVSQHMITWDRYQDGRIRVAIILGCLALTVAVIALLVAFRRPTAVVETTQRPMVCPAVNVPACPSCPPIPACPVIPPYPVCPSQRPSHGNHSHRDS